MYIHIISSLMLYNTLRQYEYIVAVADTGSLTGAASLLNVSQPSLSVAITRVEAQLGQPVFLRRKGSSVNITPYGHGVIEGARALLQQAEEIERGPAKAPPFVIGFFEDIAPWYLAPALERMHSQFPTMRFKAREGRFSDLADDLSEGRVNLAISYDVGFEGGFDRRVVQTIAPVAFLSRDHPLARRSSLELTELATHPILLFDEDLSEHFVRGLFDKLRLSPTIKQRVRSLELMRSLAAHGAGVGISYARPPADVSYDGKPLVTVPISTAEAAADISLIWSALRNPEPRFSEVLDALSQL